MNEHYEFLVNAALLVLLVVTAMGIARQSNLFAAAMLSSVYSLLCACLFVHLDAVDVAFTEAAVGAGISTVLILGTLALTEHREEAPQHPHHWLGLLSCGGIALLMIVGSGDMPAFGAADTPVHQHPLARHFLETSKEEIGIPNAVTSVLASYRGYDTLGEVAVIFTAGLTVLLLLWGRRSVRHDKS